MNKIDPVETWLSGVYLRSQSQNTLGDYRISIRQFFSFIGVSGQQIIEDYDKSSDREFRRKYAQLIKAWIGDLQQKSMASKTITSKVGAITSFFKHSDLPLGFIPKAIDYVQYHNRDISREEIALILSVAKPRDRAFFCFMAQSGLRPETICRLRLKDLEPDWTKATIPCQINVQQTLAKGKYQPYFTFIGEESIKHLKDYFATRTNVNSESLLFVQVGSENKPMDPKTISGEFNRIVRKLKANKQIDFEVRKDKPSELRLYNLRKFFKKYSNQAGEEFNEFWMGHKGKGVVDNYRTKDVEFHRKLYAEKAMPFLRIETATPSENEKIIMDLKKQLEEQREKYEERLDRLEQRVTEFLKRTEA